MRRAERGDQGDQQPGRVARDVAAVTDPQSGPPNGGPLDAGEIRWDQAAAGAGTKRGFGFDVASTSDSGIHRSQRGRYQFQSPSSFIVAGRSTPRMIVASMKMATARPTPICLVSMPLWRANSPKTATMMIAALVMVPAVVLMPWATASAELIPPFQASRTRLRMNTW